MNYPNRGNLLIKVKIEGGSGEMVKELRYNLGNDNNSTISLLVLVILVVGLVSIATISNHYIPNKRNEREKIERCCYGYIRHK